MLGQTWQEAGVAEVREETGVAVDPAALRVIEVETTPDRRQNLILLSKSRRSRTRAASPMMQKCPRCSSMHEPLDTAFHPPYSAR